jgi:hypothetical protein
MSDVESDIENIPLSTTQTSDATSSSNYSIFNNEEYRVERLERLLKTSANSKHYIVTKNSSPLLKTDASQNFGFPSKICPDGLLINERRSSLNPDIVENVLFVRSMKKTLKNNSDLFVK